LPLHDVPEAQRVASAATSPVLTIAKGVELRNGASVATIDCPWLRLEVDATSLAGKWIELTYISGFLDPLVRPVLRCFVGGAIHDETMPGALFGRANWLGRVPDGATEIWVSPTNRPGPFAFAIERLRISPRARVLWNVVRRSPQRGWVCFWARALGMRHLARLQVKRTLCATPLRHYDSWRRNRVRPFDHTGFDCRWPLDGAQQPHIRAVARLETQSSLGIPSLLAQLSAQPYPNWSLALLSAPTWDNNIESAASETSGVLFVAPGASAHAALDGLADDDLVTSLTAVNLLADYALAALARAACDHSAVDVFYGDEDFVESGGARVSPRLLPDWSAEHSPELGGSGAPAAIRVGALRASGTLWEAFVRSATENAPLPFQDRKSLVIRHIRRVLRTRPLSNPPAPPPPARGNPGSPPNEVPALRASIIIATRDQFDLLKLCVESLRARTRLGGAEVLIVDNDSVRRDTKTYLAGLAREDGFRILSMPGPFNFSRLCNQAAAQARAPLLVFLNNDTEAIEENWLEILLELASRPDVGAVGAKLLYPNGRIQHAGITIGIDGRAGHFERFLGAADSGYFGRLNVSHEVSAVTAACLAVEAAKFAAVGGFDEVNLPVELNDVDLCLRLSERGWRTLLAPVRLIHHESASRGESVRPDERYGDQHDYFRERWTRVIRDDPHFHPALSLDSLRAELG
jgi:GT2 family glycosyltransferase